MKNNDVTKEDLTCAFHKDLEVNVKESVKLIHRMYYWVVLLGIAAGIDTVLGLFQIMKGV